MDKDRRHERIVGGDLRRIAERLEQEGLISAHDNKEFKIFLFKDSEPITIRPDLVLYLPNGDKLLVEVANQEEAKRLVGELVYPAILRHCREIKASFVFVLGSEDRAKHARSLMQRTILAEILGRYNSRCDSWPGSEDLAYKKLKDFCRKIALKKEKKE